VDLTLDPSGTFVEWMCTQSHRSIQRLCRCDLYTQTTRCMLAYPNASRWLFTLVRKYYYSRQHSINA